MYHWAGFIPSGVVQKNKRGEKNESINQIVTKNIF